MSDGYPAVTSDKPAAANQIVAKCVFFEDFQPFPGFGTQLVLPNSLSGSRISTRGCIASCAICRPQGETGSACPNLRDSTIVFVNCPARASSSNTHKPKHQRKRGQLPPHFSDIDDVRVGVGSFREVPQPAVSGKQNTVEVFVPIAVHVFAHAQIWCDAKRLGQNDAGHAHRRTTVFAHSDPSHGLDRLLGEQK